MIARATYAGLAALALLCAGPGWPATLTTATETAGDGVVAVSVVFTPDSGDTVAGMQFALRFDTAQYEMTRVDAGPAASGAGKEVIYTPSDSGAAVLIAGFNQTEMPAGTVATVYLAQRSEDATGNAVYLTDGILSDPKGEAVPVSTSSQQEDTSEGDGKSDETENAAESSEDGESATEPVEQQQEEERLNAFSTTLEITEKDAPDQRDTTIRADGTAATIPAGTGAGSPVRARTETGRTIFPGDLPPFGAPAAEAGATTTEEHTSETRSDGRNQYPAEHTALARVIPGSSPFERTRDVTAMGQISSTRVSTESRNHPENVLVFLLLVCAGVAALWLRQRLLPRRK